jgi:hypothetical protein
MSSDNLPMRSATAPLLPHHNQQQQQQQAPGLYQQQPQQQQQQPPDIHQGGLGDARNSAPPNAGMMNGGASAYQVGRLLRK